MMVYLKKKTSSEHFEEDFNFEDFDLVSRIIKHYQDHLNRPPKINELIDHYKSNGKRLMDSDNVKKEEEEEEQDADVKKEEVETKESKRTVELSNLKNERNLAELEMACKRSKANSIYEVKTNQCTDNECSSLDVDSYQNHQTALIGTPLNEAKNTQVGSIMPKFKFQEYV